MAEFLNLTHNWLEKETDRPKVLIRAFGVKLGVLLTGCKMEQLHKSFNCLSLLFTNMAFQRAFFIQQ